ncbi:MAG: hypothetical protein QNJ22_08300 [Desulfosarcinaceae bacterium]|nr:hypothetical protein [Desulfosarcinaceae bacterium]
MIPCPVLRAFAVDRGRCGWLLVLALLLVLTACASGKRPTLAERLGAMADEELVAYYQGVDARLRAVGEGVRRERAEAAGTRYDTKYQQTYFLGGEGHRLFKQRQAAERELRRREIPPSVWAPPPE